MSTHRGTEPDGEGLTVPHHVLEDLVRRNESLATRVEQLERRLDERPTASGSPTADPQTPTPATGPVGRRQVLGKGLAAAGAVAAAGTAAALAAASPAAAANGQAVIIGSDVNTGTAPTGLAVGGTPRYGLGVTDNGAGSISGKPALWGHAKQQTFNEGVLGQGDNGATGVVGISATGDGVRAASGGANGFGLVAEGLRQIWVRPRSGPIPTNGNGFAGELRFTTGANDSTLWACVGGAGVTWKKLAGNGTAGSLHILPTPVRVYDSRPGTQPPQGPKAKLGNVARTIDLKVNASTVPAGATGVLLTVLLVNATNGAGNMTVWANDKAQPASNTMVWGGSAGRFTGTALSAVDSLARIKVIASLSTDIVLDVVGFYR